MGDPKFPRRSYDTPSHPWKGDRIKEETELVKQFGLKNKTELWKAKSIVRDLRRQSRNLQARTRYGEQQAQIETRNLLASCGRMGLLPLEGTTLDDVLGLSAESVLNRRLQTIVFAKGLASTLPQARQCIVHGHISIGDRIVTVPGYPVRRGEEDKIVFNPRSPLADDMHPVRVQKKQTKAEAPQKRPEEEKKPEVKIPKKLAEVVEEVSAEAPPLDIEAGEEKEEGS